MTAAVSASMRERTGRSLDEWVDLVRTEGPDPLDQKAVRAWLKEVHGVAQNTQWAIAFAVAESAGWSMPSVDQFTEALFAGPKAVLRPLHDAVVALALSMGDDAEAQGRGTYIPVVRRTQFVAVAPGPRGSLRVGFRFRELVPDDVRLAPSKGFAQSTHWVHLPAGATTEDVASLEPLVAAAYGANG